MRILWNSCRDCDFSSLERVPRRSWMRVLPGLRNYHCDQCQADVLAPKKQVEARRWSVQPLRELAVPPAPEAQRK